MREAPVYSPQSSPALAKGRGGTGERGRSSEVSTAGARCPSTAVVGLVVMGELTWAVGEGKDGEWLKGGPSHVCTDARELSGQFPHSGCCPGRFSWPPGKRRGSCSSVSANCSLPDRKRRRAIPHRSFHTPLVVSSQLPLLPSPCCNLCHSCSLLWREAQPHSTAFQGSVPVYDFPCCEPL